MTTETGAIVAYNDASAVLVPNNAPMDRAHRQTKYADWLRDEQRPWYTANLAD